MRWQAVDLESAKFFGRLLTRHLEPATSQRHKIAEVLAQKMGAPQSQRHRGIIMEHISGVGPVRITP